MGTVAAAVCAEHRRAVIEGQRLALVRVACGALCATCPGQHCSSCLAGCCSGCEAHLQSAAMGGFEAQNADRPLVASSSLAAMTAEVPELAATSAEVPELAEYVTSTS